MDTSVNVHLDDVYVSDNDNDISPFIVSVTPVPSREKASEVFSRKFIIIILSFSNIILTYLSNIR